VYWIVLAQRGSVCVLDPTHILTFHPNEDETEVIIHTKGVGDPDSSLSSWSNMLLETVSGTISATLCCTPEDYLPHWNQINPDLLSTFFGGMAGFSRAHTVVMTFDSGESRTYIWNPNNGTLKPSFKSKTFQGIASFLPIREHGAIATIDRMGGVTVHMIAENENGESEAAD